LSKDIEYNLTEDIPFKALVESNKAGLFYLENDTIVYVNEAFAEILGKSKNELKGVSIYDFVAESDLVFLKKGISEIQQGRSSSFSKEVAFRTAREEFQYFSIHLNIDDSSDSVTKIIGASRNATSRVERSDKLVKKTALFNSLYNNLKDGILVYDYVHDKILRANKSAVDILGYDSESDFVKTNFSQFIPRYTAVLPGIDCIEEVKVHGERVINGEAFKTSGVFLKKNGDEIIVHANVVPTFQVEGQAFIIFQDSTQRIVTQKKQNEAQKKYREIFENSHEGIVYTSFKTKRVIVCNDNALKIFGVDSLEELREISPHKFFEPGSVKGLNPVDIYLSKLVEALEKGKSELSFWLKKKTKEVIRVDAVAISDNSNPDDPKIITFLRDVTNLYETRLSLNNKNKELEKYIESNLQLENFAYFASHDLQTPLRTMVSFTQLLQKSLGENTTESQKEYMEMIISSSKNMHDLVNDLLSFSKVNTSKIVRSAFSIDDLLQLLMKEMALDITEKEAIICFHNIPQTIQGDLSKIKQVFQNLMTNALKFSNANTKPVIDIGLDKEDNASWTFYVKDNGIGIDPIYKEKIFMMFKRLHTKYEYEGTGIGLALVKKIIEQHKGKVWLESELGAGATFYFSLPKEG